MSAMSPHIRSHRAMAESLIDVAKGVETPVVGLMLETMALAHGTAADALEAHEHDLASRLVSIPPRNADA